MAPQTASSSIDQFLLDLIIEKHGEPMEEDLKKQMMEELKPKLDQWITLKTMTEIAQSSPTDIALLQKMTDENKPAEEIEKFIQSKIPDMSSFLTKTLLSFRQTYIGT
jgi:hypothetical protein